MKTVALALLLLTGCAAGVARTLPDGTCEVRGVAVGRSEIAAYRQRSEHDDPKVQALCARMHGGTGSSDFWDAVSAGVGAIVGWLAGS